MGFEHEYRLECAGIDPTEFLQMDMSERSEALHKTDLNPYEYLLADTEPEFPAWVTLNKAGLSLCLLSQMDKEARKKALKNAGLRKKNYQTIRVFLEETQFAAQPTERVESHEEKRETYRFCKVSFQPGDRGYCYFTGDQTVQVGEIVLVPAGLDNAPKLAKVVSVGEYTAKAAPYPVEKTKTVLRKARPDERASFFPQKEPVHVSVSQETPAASLRTGSEADFTAPAPSYMSKTKPQKDLSPWWILAVAVVIALFLAAGQASKPTTVRSSYNSYSASRSSGSSSYAHSGSKPSTPPRPSVNREQAMTKEEAERLRGTGYHGTRPNSSAEDIELKAAQNKCKNCGYRTHNGTNSLCDYCSWMERYGGGLPTQKSPDVTPAPTSRPTPKPTPRPTAKPDTSDPYHASDYSYPEDFYYDYYDDFWDYEDAEDYWYAHR